MKFQHHMGIIRTTHFIVLVISICSLSLISSDEGKKTEEVLLSQLVDSASEEIDRDMADKLWLHCKIDLIKLKVTIEELDLCLTEKTSSCTSETDMKSWSMKKESIHKMISLMHTEEKQTILDCLRKNSIIFHASGGESGSNVWYAEYIFRKRPSPRWNLGTDPLHWITKVSTPPPSPPLSQVHNLKHPSISPKLPLFPPPYLKYSLRTDSEANAQEESQKSILNAIAVTACVTFIIAALLFLCFSRFFGSGSKMRQNNESPLLTLSMTDLSVGSMKEEKSGQQSFGSNFNIEFKEPHASLNGTPSLEGMSINSNTQLRPPPGGLPSPRSSFKAPSSKIYRPPLPPPAPVSPTKPSSSVGPFPPSPGPPPSPRLAIPPGGKPGSRPLPPQILPGVKPGSCPLPPQILPGVRAGPSPPPPQILPGVRAGPSPPPPPIPPGGRPGPHPPPPSGVVPPPSPLKAALMGSKLGLIPLPAPKHPSNVNESEGPKTKLKPFFWDKVVTNPDQSMVWHHLRAGSFQFDENMIESLFGHVATDKNKKEKKKEESKDSQPKLIQIIEPKKSQNLSILLRALNVTVEEVYDALLEGNELPLEFLQTLLKMAPTPDEELKLRLFSGELAQLGPADQFLKTLVNIPFAFKRMEALLFMCSLEEDVATTKESFKTLEIACKELRNRRLFLKLLEAVLKTGNRMNDGTFHGGAQAFKLDTLLKLSDVKGADGKTTLLQFVVQEIIRYEGVRAARRAKESNSFSSVKTNLLQETLHESDDRYTGLGLEVVSGLGDELDNVKKAANMDADCLLRTVAKISHALQKTKDFLIFDMKNVEEDSGFHDALKSFVKDAEGDIKQLLEEEKRIMALVKSTGDYFHGNAGKNEGLRLFSIVRDFLVMLDKTCREVKETQKRPTTKEKEASSSDPQQSSMKSSSSFESHGEPSPHMRE